MYNLRYDSQPDTVAESIFDLGNPLSGDQPWSTRRLRVSEHFLSEGIVISGSSMQFTDLAELFGDNWHWIGVGHNDGVEAGEYSPLFFENSHMFIVLFVFLGLCLTKYPGAGSFQGVIKFEEGTTLMPAFLANFKECRTDVADVKLE
ncbi:hypothetical protein F5146DRAFT_1188999 [Armillaria mellea]|nr:hypothetical protein F5146DRAFT_1188999 [Armillaria mellea]